MNKKVLLVSVLAVFVLCVGVFTFFQDKKPSTITPSAQQNSQPLTQEDEYQMEMDTESNLPQD